jgi:hypothetical protein
MANYLKNWGLERRFLISVLIGVYLDLIRVGTWLGESVAQELQIFGRCAAMDAGCTPPYAFDVLKMKCCSSAHVGRSIVFFECSMVFHRSVRCDQEISQAATDVGAHPMTRRRTYPMTLRAVLTLFGSHQMLARLRPMTPSKHLMFWRKAEIRFQILTDTWALLLSFTHPWPLQVLSLHATPLYSSYSGDIPIKP